MVFSFSLIQQHKNSFVIQIIEIYQLYFLKKNRKIYLFISFIPGEVEW